MFVTVEIALGVLLQTCGTDLYILYSYLSVIFACLFFGLFLERSRTYLFTQLALICTVGADYFLVWSNPQIKVPAMLFFLAAQILYGARLYCDDACIPRKRWNLWSRAALSAVALTVAVIVLGENTDALSLISVVYYVNLVLNLVFAFAQFSKQYLLAIGFLLL